MKLKKWMGWMMLSLWQIESADQNYFRIRKKKPSDSLSLSRVSLFIRNSQSPFRRSDSLIASNNRIRASSVAKELTQRFP
ncbi:hypothetical protein P3S68_014684 [Capsicum galapagoense]